MGTGLVVPAVAEPAGGGSPQSIDGAKLIDGTVTDRKLALADGAIELSKVAGLSEALDELFDNLTGPADDVACTECIATAELVNGAVTNEKLTGPISLQKVPDAASRSALSDLELQLLGLGELFSAYRTTLATASLSGGTDTVHVSRIDGLADAETARARDLTCDACVEADELLDRAVTDGKIASVDAGKLTSGVLDNARIGDGSIVGAKLAERSVTADRLYGEIQAGQIVGLEAEKVSGVLTAATIDGSDVTGEISATQLAGTIDMALIAADAITGDKIATGTIGVAQLAAESVGTEELVPGAVTADKQTSNAARLTAVDLNTLTELTSGYDAPSSVDVLTTQGPAAHNVMVTGQAQLSCICSNAGDLVTVEYQLIRLDNVTGIPTRTVVSPTYSVLLRNGHNTAPVSISFLDRDVAAGDHQYTLRFEDTPLTPSATAESSASGTVINAVDLGRS